MKNDTLILVLILFLYGVQGQSQDFTGRATYKTAAKMTVSMDSTHMSADQQSLINQQIMKAMQKEFELTFNKAESNWKEVEMLDKATPQGGIQVIIAGGGGGADGLLYKHTGEKEFHETTEAFGKLFLISGELEPYSWEMTQETKQIGNYTCYKAEAKREITQMTTSEVDGKTEEKEEKKTITITAWYTPEIPVSHGPDDYWGLPGLILEVNDGSRMMVCNKIVLNPESPVGIELPKKGKKVTNEEFRAVMQEQTEKMNKMYGGGKKKGKQGTRISISSGQ